MFANDVTALAIPFFALTLKFPKERRLSESDFAIEYVLRGEGGLSENPHDAGGITNFGISLRFLKNLSSDTLRKYGIFEEPTEQTIRDLTVEQTKKIYKGEFWDHAPFEKIGSQDAANFIFDSAVNMGISPAIKIAQRACWAVMKRCDLVDDGVLGAKTLLALKTCGFLLMPALRSERAGYYRIIVAEKPDQKEFITGWLNRAYETSFSGKGFSKNVKDS